MADRTAPTIDKILSDVDVTLRRRLTKQDLVDTDHIILAIASDGAAVIRSNCGTEALTEMAAMLMEIADQKQVTGDGKPN